MNSIDRIPYEPVGSTAPVSRMACHGATQRLGSEPESGGIVRIVQPPRLRSFGRSGQSAATGRSAAEGGRAVLFVTDELFLPLINGSAQVYANVARHYAAAGWKTYCLSFYRNIEQASAPQTLAAYNTMFSGSILAPGWNLGGTLAGKVGMAWREISRWSRGNIFATHPLLRLCRNSLAQELVRLVRDNGISEIYFHKPHTLMLLQPVLDSLKPARFVIDLHDDFVARATAYSAAYASLFANVGFAAIVRQHGRMYLRHRLSRTNVALSLRKELALLAQCDEILVSSDIEFERYARIPDLLGRVKNQPWPYSAPASLQPAHTAQTYDAGFIGADSVMNLDAVIHFRDNILPLVLRQLPDFRILIAGTLNRKIRPLLSGLSSFAVWSDLRDVADFYGAVRMAAIPLRYGTGVSVKAIEALAYGCPLVTTRVGVRGITSAVLASHDVDVTDDPAAFAAALVRRCLAARVAGTA